MIFGSFMITIGPGFLVAIQLIKEDHLEFQKLLLLLIPPLLVLILLLGQIQEIIYGFLEECLLLTIY